ncbi:MAG: hypothetical protein Q9217_002244 [Psora testacea]
MTELAVQQMHVLCANAVSRAIYPVPTKKAIAEHKMRPKESGVPSSSSWNPTRPFNSRTHNVATIDPRWTAVNPCSQHKYLAQFTKNMHTYEPNLAVKREAADGKYLTDRNDDVADEE